MYFCIFLVKSHRITIYYFRIIEFLISVYPGIFGSPATYTHVDTHRKAHGESYRFLVVPHNKWEFFYTLIFSNYYMETNY